MGSPTEFQYVEINGQQGTFSVSMECVNFYKYQIALRIYDLEGVLVAAVLDKDTTFAFGRRLSIVWGELRVF